MSNPQVTLRLEYVVRSKDHADLVEPLLFVREFQPVVFRWDTLSNLHGAAVLAVQVKDLLNNVPTYGLYRVRSETDPELEDGLAPTQVTMQCSAVKVVWEDAQFTMAYIFQQEQGRTSSDTALCAAQAGRCGRASIFLDHDRGGCSRWCREMPGTGE